MSLEDHVGRACAAYAHELLARLRAVAAERLLGAWLVGSAALDDFDPRRSDLDVQAIVVRRLERGERAALAAALAHEALPCPARGLELVVYAREDLGDPAGPAFGLNLNTGREMQHHVALDPDDDPRFWFVIDVSIARQQALTLAGPPSSDAFPEQPRALVVAALLEAMEWYDRHGGSPAQTLLGACRTWAWATDGRWRSKGESARWARERLADPRPVDRALRARGASASDAAPAPALDDADVAPVLALARAALVAAA